MANQISNIKNLKLLMWMRNLAIAGQIIAIVVVTEFLEIPLSQKPLFSIISILILANIATYFRIKKASNITNEEFLGQLLIDIFSLSALLYYTGGATNPFASLFILQVIIAAVSLRALYTWIIAALTIALYTGLMFYKIEVPYFMHHHIGEIFSFHVQGMWISFMLLAITVAWFIVKMNQTIYRQNTLLLEAEKIAALGNLATNAAHELGTPLATMSIISEDLDDKTREKFAQHIKRCKEIISQIAAEGGANRAEGGNKTHIESFLQETAQEWQKKNEGVNFIHIFKGQGNPSIIAEQSLQQTLWNLLDNSFDASSENITLKAKWTSNKLHINIKDDGEGISKQIAKSIGNAGQTTKENGMGLGFFLAKSVIARLEGTINISSKKSNNKNNNETNCKICIPLKSIAL